MRIAVVGRGRVGGGLARRWTSRGHDVTAFGREGGNASGADVVVIAIPGNAVTEGLARVAGLAGQVTIDATNTFAPPPSGHASVAAQVKAVVGGRTVRATLPGASEPALRGLAGVSAVELHGDAVRLTCTDSDAALRALLAAEPAARDIEVGGADLEDAFVALTSTGHHS